MFTCELVTTVSEVKFLHPKLSPRPSACIRTEEGRDIEYSDGTKLDKLLGYPDSKQWCSDGYRSAIFMARAYSKALRWKRIHFQTMKYSVWMCIFVS